MGERLFSTITVSYTMIDPNNPSNSIPRKVFDVIDIHAFICQTARSAVQLGMEITVFTVEVSYE